MKPSKNLAMAASTKFIKSLKSFARQEPRKFGNLLVVAFLLLSLCVLSLIKLRYCPSCGKSQDHNLKVKLQKKMVVQEINDAFIIDEDDNEEEEDQMYEDQVKAVINGSRPTCYEVSSRSDTCEIAGDIRIEASSGTVFFDSSSPEKDLKIKPYARKGDLVALSNVREWSLKPLSSSGHDHHLPKCTKKHSVVPAVMFSVGGFTGNTFHDFTDVLVPLFISAYQFHGEVHLLAADYRSWWINKFKAIFKQLSNYEVIDLDNVDGDEVRCFRRVIIGPSFHKELGVDGTRTPKGYTILDFKDVLREAYGLQRGMASRGSDAKRKPGLLIIARQRSRAFVNLKGMIETATSLGFQVTATEPDANTNLADFAKTVNSADVMVGVHGAGLTNMVFLPMKAVVIQVIPLGGMEWLARDSFRDAALEMKMGYMDHVIQDSESTLSEVYGKDDPVLKDPSAIHKQGWNALKSIYLDKQNVKIDLGKFKELLLDALQQLPDLSS